jgi:hypothetical protein
VQFLRAKLSLWIRNQVQQLCEETQIMGTAKISIYPASNKHLLTSFLKQYDSTSYQVLSGVFTIEGCAMDQLWLARFYN